MILVRYCWEILESAVNPLFFRKAVQRPAIRAFGYYLFFTTVYALAVSGAGLWFASRHWNPALDLVQRKLPQFRIGVSQGYFSTTLPQPTVWGDKYFSVIVDLDAQAIDLSEFDSAIAVTRTKAVMKRSAFETREYRFAGLPDFQFTTADAVGWLRKNERTILWSVFGTLALVVIPTLWMIAIPVILVLSLVLMVPAAVIRARLNYAQMLTIGFYAVTFPTLLQTYFAFQGYPTHAVYRWVYVTWFAVGILAAYHPAKTDGTSPSSPPPPVI